MCNIRLAVTALLISACVFGIESTAYAGAQVHVASPNSSQNYYFDSATNVHNPGQNYITGAANYYVAVSPDGTRAYTTAITSNIISVDNLTHVPPSPVTDIALAGGSIPIGIDVNPAGTRAYAVLNGPDTVAVIDTSNNTILTSVATGANPYGVKVTPDGAQVWVTHQASGTVYVIASDTNTLVTGDFYPILSGSGATEIAFTPDSATAFVTNKDAGSITAIDVGTPDPGGFKVILVGATPLGIAMRPDGEYAYVTNEGSGTVSVIAVTDGSCATKGHTPPCVHTTLTVGASPRDVEFTPDGAFAYVANGGSANVSIINAQTHTVTGAVTINNFPAPELYGIAIAPPPDADGDGVGDDEDNCVNTHNPGQENYDMDALGDACDPDDDNDGQSDEDESSCGSNPFDEFDTSPDNDGDNVPDCVDDDDDNDSFDDAADNCPFDSNPMQSDADKDGFGDVCDSCPADPADTCDPNGSAAMEISSAGGGTLNTPDGILSLDFDPGDLAADTTIVAASAGAPGLVELVLASGDALGDVLASYDLQPDGLELVSPAILTIVIDVSGLTPEQRAELNLYLKQGESTYAPVDGASCDVAEGPPGTFIATCMAEIAHFSVYALITPTDTDGDGVFDSYGGESDNCPDDPNPNQRDYDGNGIGDVCDPEYVLGDGFEEIDP